MDGEVLAVVYLIPFVFAFSIFAFPDAGLIQFGSYVSGVVDELLRFYLFLFEGRREGLFFLWVSLLLGQEF